MCEAPFILTRTRQQLLSYLGEAKALQGKLAGFFEQPPRKTVIREETSGHLEGRPNRPIRPAEVWKDKPVHRSIPSDAREAAKQASPATWPGTRCDRAGKQSVLRQETEICRVGELPRE